MVNSRQQQQPTRRELGYAAEFRKSPREMRRAYGLVQRGDRATLQDHELQFYAAGAETRAEALHDAHRVLHRLYGRGRRRRPQRCTPERVAHGPRRAAGSSGRPAGRSRRKASTNTSSGNEPGDPHLAGPHRDGGRR